MMLIVNKGINPVNILTFVSNLQNEVYSTNGINVILIYFLASIASLLVLLWIILTIIRIKASRDTQVVAAPEGNNEPRNRN